MSPDPGHPSDQRAAAEMRSIVAKPNPPPAAIKLEYTLQQAMATANVTALLEDLTPEQRLLVFSRFCTHCGSNNPKCQCWNDA